MFGKLKVVVSADLGKLGDKTGAPVEVTVGWGQLPFGVLGWAVLLALMFLGPNRTARAWGVWVVVILLQGTISLLTFASGEMASSVAGPYAGLVFALGAFWLLTPYVSSKGWPTTFWGAFGLILIGTCVFGIGGLDTVRESGFLIFLLYVGFNSGLGFALALRSCRKNPHIGAFIGWFLLWSCVLWVVTGVPWVVVAVTEAGPIALMALFVVLIAAGAGAGVTLAFVILSAVEPFYRARFRAFLGELPAPEPPTAPPVVTCPTS